MRKVKSLKLRVKSCRKRRAHSTFRTPHSALPWSVPLVRAASELGEIGHRILAAAAAMKRIGETGQALEIYPKGPIEELLLVNVHLCEHALAFDVNRLQVKDEIFRLFGQWEKTVKSSKLRVKN